MNTAGNSGVSALPWPTLAASVVAGLIVAATIGLWAYFGTTVFLEMVAAGFAACF